MPSRSLQTFRHVAGGAGGRSRDTFFISFAAVVTSPVARLAHEFKSTRWRLFALALWAEQ